MPDAVSAWTAAHDHVRVADRLHLVHVVQVDATVELRVQLVEERHHLGGGGGDVTRGRMTKGVAPRIDKEGECCQVSTRTA